MAEKELKIKVTTEADMSQLDDLKSTLEEVKSTASELGNTGSESLNEISNEADDTNSSVGELGAGVDDLGNTLDGIDGENLSEVGSEADNVASSTDEAASSADELNNSLGGIDGSGLSGAASEADGLADSLNNATGSADELGTSLGVIESASLMGLAEGIGQYADGAENLAQTMNEASISVGQLATQAGIAEPQMVSLINNISNATFPQAEAMQYVQLLDQLGVSASQLGDAATNMDRINDAFGIGSDKVVQLTGSLKALGVDAANLPSTFNALAYAQSNVAGGVNQFATVLQRLGPSFSEYGYNVDQAAVITAAASQKWGTGRKAMRELSSALKEANGDTQALEQSLGLQPGALSNASAATQEYEGQLQSLADEEAQHKTWLDQLSAAWEDISLSLSPILSPLASFIGLIGQIGQFALAINSITTLVQSIRGLSIISSIAPMVSGGIGAISSALSFLAANPVVLVVVAIVALIAILWYLYNTNEDVRKAIDGLIDGLKNIGQTIYGYLVGAFEWLQGAWQNTVDWFNNGVATIVAAFEWLQGAWNNVVSIFSNGGAIINAIFAAIQIAWQYVVDWFTNGINNIVSAFDLFNQSIQDAAQWIWDSLIATLEYLQGAWQNTVDFFTTGGQMISDAITGAFQWIQDTFMGVVTFFQTYGPLIAQILFVMATGGVGAIVLLIGQFNGMPTQLGAIFQNIIGRITSFVGSMVSNMVNGATRAVSGFINGIAQLPGKVYNELAKTLDRVIQWGSQIVAKLGEIAQRAWQAFINGLGIGSPGYIQILTLKELSDTGKRVPQVAQGIVENLSKMSDKAVAAWGTPTLTVESDKNNKLTIGNASGVNNNNLTDILNALTVALNGNGNNEPTLIFNLYGDIDDDKRMEKFLNAVRKELAWNNKTAGRTV